MTDSLLQAYAPLLIWPGLGFLLFRVLPDTVPRFLGRALYWVGVPLQIFTLARQTNWNAQVGLAPPITIASLVLALSIAWLTLQGLRRRSADLPNAADQPLPSPLAPTAQAGWHDAARRGSFLLCAMLGNTGFVGLAIAPSFIDELSLSWIVFYSVTQNVIGTYGIGVYLASFYGNRDNNRQWWVQIRDVLTVPSLWAFALGSLTHSVELPLWVDASLHQSLFIVIPTALLLMGMRLSQLKGWASLKWAIAPATIKTVILPMLIGLLGILLQLPPNPRLGMALMSGMPTAFAGLILAEEYDLDRELVASSILISSLMLLITIPVWLVLFG